ncbi:MAG: pyridoxamine 5'-phosphate oxidase [Bacteroidetes bacterium]|nr:pyridoxamine 5'-phosphate oxidase [Bacteroidota bacterium]MBK7970099.1 pyridoxamine 5'-phosphate oxidase [Bacteroidota bacterium]MBK9048252.1 pyridoxamine 5'-phosphate oxidase [Bacteroidota bacterium]MBK9425362.1 pyridoxamine 5'-phosphate oxidase [Bacteroidota bacterium]
MDHIRDFVKNIRTDYNLDTLDINTVEANPIAQFAIWMKIAVDANVNEPNAFNLATIGNDGRPSSRVVLLRNFDYDGFVFFTNYQSHKGQDLDQNKWAALNFFWPELHKQVRILGKAEKVDVADSEEYFSTRPRESQLGAWVSEQSKHLSGRDELEQNLKNLTAQFEGKSIPRPAHWGGYRINPIEMEFWQGRPSRLHDRVKYELSTANNWKASLLYP